MEMLVSIVKVLKPIKTNSSFGNYAIGVDFKYLNGFKANTYKYSFTLKDANRLYSELVSRIGKPISMYEL